MNRCMNVISLIVALIVGSLLWGCSNHSNKDKGGLVDGGLIQVDLTPSVDTLYLSSCIEKVETLPLLLPEDEVIGNVSRIYFTDSLMYLLDGRLKMITCFDRNGRWKQTFNQVGPGPREYLDIRNFWIHHDTMYIHDQRQFRINLYTLSGTYLKTISCEKYFSAITMASDTTFLCFLQSDVANNPKGAWLMNEEGRFVRSLLSYDEAYPEVITPWSSMYRDKDGRLCYYFQLDNCSYRYCNDTLQLNWRMEVTQKTVASYPGLSNSIHIKGECYVPVCLVDDTDWLWCTWGNKKGGDMKFMLYHKPKGELQVSDLVSVEDLPVPQLGRPVPTNLPDVLVTVVPHEYEYVLQFYRFRRE